jgi:hypothetical protein
MEKSSLDLIKDYRTIVNENWEDGYWKGDMKDGYPTDYWDENDSFEFPWEKRERENQPGLDRANPNNESVELSSTLAKYGFVYDTPERYKSDFQMFKNPKLNLLVSIGPKDNFWTIEFDKSNGKEPEYLEDGNGVESLLDMVGKYVGTAREQGLKEEKLTENKVNIKSKEFDTEEEADKWADNLYGKYPQGGYGTSLDVKKLPNEKFIVTGYRWDSCE